MQNNKERLDKLWIYVNLKKYLQSFILKRDNFKIEKNHINTDNSKFYTEYVKKQT